MLHALGDFFFSFLSPKEGICTVCRMISLSRAFHFGHVQTWAKSEMEDRYMWQSKSPPTTTRWVMKLNDSSWARRDAVRTSESEKESEGKRGRAIVSSQEIEATASKLSSGHFGGQEPTNQFGLLLSACQPHRRTPWHPIIRAQQTTQVLAHLL